MVALEPHHDGSACYVSTQQPALGDRVALRVAVPHGAGVTGVHLRVVPDGEQEFHAARRVHDDGVQVWWQVEVSCHNPVTGYRFLLDGPGGYRWLNGSGVHPRDVPDAHDFRLVTYRPPPDWAGEAVVYQVFPDRFARDGAVAPAAGPDAPRTDLPDWAEPAGWQDPVDLRPGHGEVQVYGGTLDGVRERLDHLVELGVTVLYLTPVFPARSNHRYDAATFDEVDPVLGGTPALERLQAAAHERGIRVLGDITTNHTGDAHEWFRSAQEDPAGPHGDFYVRDPRGHAVTWLGVPSLPKLDHRSPGLTEAMITGEKSALRRWLAPGAGLDGWRVDVANMTGRYRDVDLAHEVARRCRAAVDGATGGDGLLVAEHVHDHSHDAQGDGWHGVMNYSGFTRPVWTWLRDPGFAPKFLGSPLRVPRLGAELVAATVRDFTALVPWRTLVHSFALVGSHDTTRVRTLVGEDGRDRVVAAAALVLTLPGVPMITYGDEIGMRGDFGEDGRRPMPWGARGSDPELWDEELHARYRSLVRARRERVSLHAGGLRWLHAEGDALVYLREHAEEVSLVHVSRGRHGPVRVPLAWLPGAEDGHEVVAAGTEPVVEAEHLALGASQAGVTVWSWARAAPAWAERTTG